LPVFLTNTFALVTITLTMMLSDAARHLARGSLLTRAGSNNPYYSPEVHRYMVAEENNSDGSIRYHAVELIGTELPKGKSYDQLVLYSDLGDVSSIHFVSSWVCPFWLSAGYQDRFEQQICI
jgi:hypothetical protein